MSTLTYSVDVRWSFTSLATDVEKVGPLELSWELTGDPISDDYTLDNNPLEIWRAWIASVREREAYDKHLGAPYVPIHWYVAGEESGTFEAAPYAEKIKATDEDFLSYYTVPVNTETGEPVNWLRLPVQEKLWREGNAAKGGFVTEVSGWKPSPFLGAVDLNVFAAAGLPTT